MLCDGDPFENIKIGDTVKLYHPYPINSSTITVQREAIEAVFDSISKVLTEEDIKFIESKGYTVKND